MTNIDYLRLATWNTEAYISLNKRINEKFPGDWVPSKWLQYNGRKHTKTGIFRGSGHQNNKPHYIYHASGENSVKLLDYVLAREAGHQFYCTRVDVCQTIRHPDVNLRRVWKSNPHKTKRIDESDSITVYLGGRTSDWFTRLYQKFDNRYLRLEFEIKGQASRDLWRRLLANKATWPAVLQSAFITGHKKSKLGAWSNDAYNLNPDNKVIIDATDNEDIERAILAKIQWLENTETALMRLMLEHTYSHNVQAMIARLLLHSTKLD